ncbi:acyl-CoA N-acyltransferase [Tricholoma matsutake]|nr:acyl-CoA N-acyltransferase [Tricholoma matsutake 945]
MTDRSNIDYKPIPEGDVEKVLKLEQQSFPADEAAILETLRFRQSKAPGLFLGAYIAHELVGYVSATLSSSTTLTHESMSNHNSKGTSVCIHGVCVVPARRRERIGLHLLDEYVTRQAASTNEVGEPLERIILITHEELRPFYEKAGFEWLGKSEVVHGSLPWYEMRKILRSSSSVDARSIPGLPPAQVRTSESRELPSGLWEMLQRPRSNKPASRLYASFPSGITDLIQPHSQQQGESVNKCDLLCPRSGCGSVILKHGVASWVERASVQMEPEDHPTHEFLGKLPAPPETTHWWLVTPSPMQFENIGFSRSLHAQGPSGKQMKLLACAECNLGPLGWSEEGGSEFWLACARVGYLI